VQRVLTAQFCAVLPAAHARVIDAETLLGEFLKATPKATGTRGQIAVAPRDTQGRIVPGAYQAEVPGDAPQTLKALGIDKRESSEANPVRESCPDSCTAAIKTTAKPQILIQPTA
jgi:hypothetical protein